MLATSRRRLGYARHEGFTIKRANSLGLFGIGHLCPCHGHRPVENPHASTWQIIVKLVQNAVLNAILPGGWPEMGEPRIFFYLTKRVVDDTPNRGSELTS